MTRCAHVGQQAGRLEVRSLGRTGLPVTALGFGGAGVGNLGRAVDDDTARAAVDTAWEGGVRLFDTAPHFGLGLSERRLGAALAGRPRADFTLCTRVGRLLRPNPVKAGSDLERGGFAVRDDLSCARDFSADGVRRSLAESLLRLGLDRVDVLFVHDPEGYLRQVVEETFPALSALRDEGLVRAVGVATGRWETAARLVGLCADREVGLDVVQLAGPGPLRPWSSGWAGLWSAARRGRGVHARAAAWSARDRGVQLLVDTCRQRGVAPMASVPPGAVAPSRYPVVAHFQTPEQVTAALESVRTRSAPASGRTPT